MLHIIHPTRHGLEDAELLKVKDWSSSFSKKTDKHRGTLENSRGGKYDGFISLSFKKYNLTDRSLQQLASGWVNKGWEDVA